MNLFFDLDGTISDPHEGITKSINFALAKLNAEEKELRELSKYIGPSLRIAFGELLETSDDALILKAISFYRERYFSKGFKENELYQGIADLLKRLKEEGHKQFVVTSKREDIARSVIRYFGLSDCFDGIYGCDIDLSKEELIKQILNENEISPEDAIMIGDREFDITAGIENGLKTIGVLWGYGSREELESAGASQIAGSVDELCSLLQFKESNESIIRHIIFDWGDTLMHDDVSRSDAMYLWPDVCAVEGAEVTLKYLSSKYQISIATSAAQSDEMMVMKALQRVSLDEYISHIFTGMTIGRKKSDIEFWRSIQLDLSADPEEIMVVGDSFENDVVMPARAGFHAIRFNPNSEENQMGERYRTIHKLTELTH